MNDKATAVTITDLLAQYDAIQAEFAEFTKPGGRGDELEASLSTRDAETRHDTIDEFVERESLVTGDMVPWVRKVADAADGLRIGTGLTSWGDIGAHMTCSEAVALADVFDAFGLHDKAQHLMTGHFYADPTEGDTEIEEHGDGEERDSRITPELMYLDGEEPF